MNKYEVTDRLIDLFYKNISSKNISYRYILHLFNETLLSDLVKDRKRELKQLEYRKFQGLHHNQYKILRNDIESKYERIFDDFNESKKRTYNRDLNSVKTILNTNKIFIDKYYIQYRDRDTGNIKQCFDHRPLIEHILVKTINNIIRRSEIKLTWDFIREDVKFLDITSDKIIHITKEEYIKFLKDFPEYKNRIKEYNNNFKK